jgi:hypothetical protein
MTSDDQLAHAAMLAWGRVKRAQSRNWSQWMTIGEGLLVGRKWAMHRAGTNRPEGKGYILAFNEWMRQWRLHDIDRSDRANLLRLMEELPAVEEWRGNTLTEQERRNLNNPTLVWRKWKALERPRQSRSSPDGARLRRTNEQLQARVEELEQELEQARVKIFKLESERQQEKEQ